MGLQAADVCRFRQEWCRTWRVHGECRNPVHANRIPSSERLCDCQERPRLVHQVHSIRYRFAHTNPRWYHDYERIQPCHGGVWFPTPLWRTVDFTDNCILSMVWSKRLHHTVPATRNRYQHHNMGSHRCWSTAKRHWSRNRLQWMRCIVRTDIMELWWRLNRVPMVLPSGQQLRMAACRRRRWTDHRFPFEAIHASWSDGRGKQQRPRYSADMCRSRSWAFSHSTWFTTRSLGSPQSIVLWNHWWCWGRGCIRWRFHHCLHRFKRFSEHNDWFGQQHWLFCNEHGLVQSWHHGEIWKLRRCSNHYARWVSRWPWFDCRRRACCHHSKQEWSCQHCQFPIGLQCPSGRWLNHRGRCCQQRNHNIDCNWFTNLSSWWVHLRPWFASALNIRITQSQFHLGGSRWCSDWNLANSMGIRSSASQHCRCECR